MGWGSDELLREFVCVGEKESDAAFGVKLIECLGFGVGSRR